MRRDAENKRIQADELERRGVQAEGDINLQAHDAAEMAEVLASSRGGWGGGTGTLGALVRNETERLKAVGRMKEDVAFRAAQLRKGADASDQLSSDQYTAGLIGATGSLIGGAYRVGKDNGWFSSSSANQTASGGAG